MLPISRKWRVDDMMRQIAELEEPEGITVNVFLMLDNIRITKEYVLDKLKKYNSTKKILSIYNTHSNGVAEANVNARRKRISEVWNKAKKFIPDSTDLIFGIEDDTSVEKDTLIRLYTEYQSLLDKKIDIGILSGVQVGRWGYRMIGAWKFDNIEDPQMAETVPYPADEDPILQEVDATGLYCFLTRNSLFKKIEFRYGAFGPDVFFGLDVRRDGFRNFIRWDIIASHVTRHTILIPKPDCVVVQYKKKDGQWKRTLPAPIN